MIDRIEEEGETVFQHYYYKFSLKGLVVASLDGEFWAYDSGDREPSGPFPDLRSALAENSTGHPFLAVGPSSVSISSNLSTEELLDLLDVSWLEPGDGVRVNGTRFNLLDISWLDSWVTPLKDPWSKEPVTGQVTRTEQRRASTVSRSGASTVLVQEEPLVFSGTLMEGPYFNLLRFAGIESLSDEQHDALWSETTGLGLLEACWSVDRESVGEDDPGPGRSDEYFEFTVSSPIRFQAELRNIISKRLNLSDVEFP